MKIRPVGAELLHAGLMDGQTDGRTDRHDEVNTLFPQREGALKKIGPIFMPYDISILISHTSSPVMTMMIMAMMTVILFCSTR